MSQDKYSSGADVPCYAFSNLATSLLTPPPKLYARADLIANCPSPFQAVTRHSVIVLYSSKLCRNLKLR